MKTQIFEKGNLSSDKIFIALFLVLIGFDKPQGTFLKGPKGFLTFTVEVRG